MKEKNLENSPPIIPSSRFDTSVSPQHTLSFLMLNRTQTSDHSPKHEHRIFGAQDSIGRAALNTPFVEAVHSSSRPTNASAGKHGHEVIYSAELQCKPQPDSTSVTAESRVRIECDLFIYFYGSMGTLICSCFRRIMVSMITEYFYNAYFIH
ncbi:hypothetical protein CEXT_111001 [Caerostris extrusa]|uniref:Uncharacterized protein n=1 Tax=Caerostris extrusa TaxID=172846 RepID=A0AAV4X7L7_CAEEX|nr:hypothetical protein CEXT_111001 [Caerostris extrusa]